MGTGPLWAKLLDVAARKPMSGGVSETRVLMVSDAFSLLCVNKKDYRDGDV